MAAAPVASQLMQVNTSAMQDSSWQFTTTTCRPILCDTCILAAACAGKPPSQATVRQYLRYRLERLGVEPALLRGGRDGRLRSIGIGCVVCRERAMQAQDGQACNRGSSGRRWPAAPANASCRHVPTEG